MIPNSNPSNKVAASPPRSVASLTSSDPQLYDQLGELARFIDTTLKTISQFSDPMSATTEQLPEAASHLKDLKRLTEEGAHQVMRLVETIQENHRNLTNILTQLMVRLSSGLDQEMVDQLSEGLDKLALDDKRLTDIITSLSFQDLVAQRVNKLVTIIEEVEHRLLELVVVFGPYKKGAGSSESSKATAMLKQLEASKSTAMNQDLADEILKQFGFS